MSPYDYCDDQAYVELLTLFMFTFALMIGIIIFLVQKLLSYRQSDNASREAKN